MYTHFRGTTFQFIGQMQDDGVVQDLTNCHLSATVFNKAGDVTIGVLSINVVSAPDGIVELSFPDTSNWPIGIARIDTLLTLPDTTLIASEPDYFRVAQTPMLD